MVGPPTEDGQTTVRHTLQSDLKTLDHRRSASQNARYDARSVFGASGIARSLAVFRGWERPDLALAELFLLPPIEIFFQPLRDYRDLVRNGKPKSLPPCPGTGPDTMMQAVKLRVEALEALESESKKNAPENTSC
ncbi:hypothetical protein PGTUg99_022086 [Puccinia graminis f. sp. tritici]|uniref:Uncharacterized protein n=1 Tax=Puccinia graminis f. sp. tritici TaxID=56615 RepID=A0A5B0RU21_PUCGR|nr:hypothetical protein PGTUg99_022086 [Puccinia graminis f. sp. tritici]